MMIMMVIIVVIWCFILIRWLSDDKYGSVKKYSIWASLVYVLKCVLLFCRQHFSDSGGVLCSLQFVDWWLADITGLECVCHMKPVKRRSERLQVCAPWNWLWDGCQPWLRDSSPFKSCRNSASLTSGGTCSSCSGWSGTERSWSSSSCGAASTRCWTASSSRRTVSRTSPSWCSRGASTRTGTWSSAATGWLRSSCTACSSGKETVSRCSWATSQTFCACGSLWPRWAAPWLSSTPTSRPAPCCTASTAAEPGLWSWAQVITSDTQHHLCSVSSYHLWNRPAQYIAN